MLKRLVVAIVGLVGVVVIALGVASATLWRADDVLVAQLQADEPLVVTDPGVLELAASEVTVRAEADGPVVLAIGRDTDVVGWVGEDPHQRVTGLSGWHELAAEDVAAPTPTADASATPAEEAPVDDEAPAEDAAAGAEAPAEDAAAEQDEAPAVPDPAGSDMWTAEATGDGEAEITWTAQPGRWSVLAASTDGSPLRLSLAWPQVVTTPWLWPCVVVGALLVLVSAALLLRDVRRGRRGADAAWTPVLTGPLPVVDGNGGPVQLTRRQLRELAEHGAVTGTGVRASRDDAPRGDAPSAGVPAPTSTTAGTTGAAASAPHDGDAAARPADPARGTGALGGMAPATRRALRAVTSRGSAAREQAAPTTPEPAAPSAPAAARTGAPDGTDRPLWRPTAPQDAPQAPPRADAQPATRSGAGAPSQERPDGPTPAPGAAPGGAWPVGAPRWSGGGGSPSPWSATGPAAPAGADARAGQDRPHGRPAWLGSAGSSPEPARTADGRLPAPGAPGSPDAPRGAAASPSRHGTAGAPVAPSGPAPARSARPGPGTAGWGAVPPAPGPVAGRVSGPDAPARSVPSNAVTPDAPTARPGAGSPPADARPAWLRDTPVPTGPRAGSTPEAPGGSRADAWRRAWGLASTEDDPTSEEER
ncbi:hypothetical protein [Cellulomonas xiejunii]|uniref:hypothetical protein n=1 Tax=Cellulomonas xiejunii TaxID=2968083 RepID=UPI001D0E6978|nr:hypothetical protein [Cellulomonas xiejunii]MCC2314391.1 hypothetical protein [Cellulomonas xiejunii]